MGLWQSPSSPVLGAPGVSPVWVVCALLCSWASVAVVMSMDGIDCQADWLRGLAVTIVDELFCLG